MERGKLDGNVYTGADSGNAMDSGDHEPGLTALGLDTETRIGGSILFFGYDVVKIPILLCVLIFLVSCLQSFFPPARSRRIMGRYPSPRGRCSRICFWGSGSAP